MASINLQRRGKVYFSTIDLTDASSTAAQMTPSNTFQVEVLAGFATTQGSAVQDITSLESGLTPDRSQQRFRTAINPVDWNFDAYLRPTGINVNTAANAGGAGTGQSGFVTPLCDWALWQMLVTNTAPGMGNTAFGVVNSTWTGDATNGGTLYSNTTTDTRGVAGGGANFGRSTQTNMYFVLDQVIYHVSDAVINQATVDGSLEGIGTTTWTGFGSEMTELQSGSDARAKAVAVFGGQATIGTGSPIVANAVSTNFQAASSFQPWGTSNVNNVSTRAGFITNRLTEIDISHSPDATPGNAVRYRFPITGCTIEYNNGVTYLTPEELGALNAPIGSFAGSRQISGSVTMYLKAGTAESAQFLRNIQNDSRTSSAATTSAKIILGGSTYNRVVFDFPAAEFAIPEINIEDVISMTATFVGQEANATRGEGGEVKISAFRVDGN